MSDPLEFPLGLLVGLLLIASPTWCDETTQPSATTNPTTQAIVLADSYQEFVRRADEVTDKRDLAAMRALAEECEQRWGQMDPILYARELLYLSQSLSTYNFKNDVQYGLSQAYALQALRKVPNLSMYIRLKLLDQVQRQRDETGAKVVGEKW